MIKKNLFQLGLFILIYLFLSSAAFSQRIDSLLNDSETKFPQEKIYLQYDRPYYNPGETIWFKMYLLATSFPNSISGTAYAELLNEKGTVLQRKIMPVYAYGASSSFDIPDSIRGNALFVRAYTSWMLNFDSSFQYFKQLSLIPKNAGRSKPAESYTLTFFPEGGDVIAGAPCRIAFKACNQNGQPINSAGNIVDEGGKIVSTFASSHDGMGSFLFNALPGKSYKANWKDKKGILHETMLPSPKANGIALSINFDGPVPKYTLERPPAVSDDFKSFYIIAQMQQQLVYSARINMAVKTKVTAALPTDNIDGIMQVTIFNAQQIPVAQRLIFVKHGNYFFNTDLHAIELNLGKRRKNVLQIDVGDTTLSNLSVAVIDESLNPTGGLRENIFSELLLTSDLKGRVYNPAQYFVSDDDSLNKQLDLVMLTNGWSRFKWEDIMAGRLPAIKYLPENNLSVGGTVYGPSKLLLKDKSITAIVNTKNGGSEILLIGVNQDGSFKTDHLMFFDTAKVYYQFNVDKEKKLTNASSFNFNGAYIRESKVPPLMLNSSFLTSRPDSITERKNRLFAQKERDQFFEGNKIKELGTVVVTTKAKSPQRKMEDEYTSGLFSGGDGYTFITETDPFAKSAISILDYLKSKVAGLQVTTGGTPTISWRGSATSLFLNESPSEVTAIQNVQMSDVAMVKVYRPPFFGASGGGAGGAVAVYLKKGGNRSQNVKGLDFVNIAGYSVIREFYSPDYEQALDINKADDLRSTIYWSPNLLLDKNTRRLKISFFNSDNCTKYRVIIEGLNGLGQLTHEEKLFSN